MSHIRWLAKMVMHKLGADRSDNKHDQIETKLTPRGRKIKILFVLQAA